MRYGNLDRLVTIQRRTATQSASGAPIEMWASVAHRRAASYRPMRGDERFSSAQEVAGEDVEFVIRYSADVADVSPLDRVLYPPPSDRNVQTPPDGTVFDILAVPELGRREGLRIVARRRADV